MQNVWQLGIAMVVATSVASLLAHWLTASTLPALKRFKNKSTWKLVEIPWLALAGCSILMAQQSFMFRDYDSQGRLLHSRFATIVAVFEMTAEQFYHSSRQSDSTTAPAECTHSRYYIELKPPVAFCDWLQRTTVSMRYVQAFLHSMEMFDGEDPGASSAFGLLEEAFKHPMSPVPFARASSEAGALAEAYFHQTVKWEDSFRIGDAKHKCEPVRNESTKEDFRTQSIGHLFLLSCTAGHLSLAYLAVVLNSYQGTVVSQKVLALWPLVLMLGLGFRIARTVAEYGLDRKSEKASGSTAKSGADTLSARLQRRLRIGSRKSFIEPRNKR